MKLVKFRHLQAYWFTLFFANGESKDVDLESLIGTYVSLNELKTAQVNSEWGCLEFNEGHVDIEPKTLYRYAYGLKSSSEYSEAA
ncbi:MAG: DUF2442 domain-containing protein [Methyloprofundus sp.]|nr:DUF2442 domain-containing protein [Methyloprofundus sp.]